MPQRVERKVFTGEVVPIWIKSSTTSAFLPTWAFLDSYLPFEFMRFVQIIHKHIGTIYIGNNINVRYEHTYVFQSFFWSIQWTRFQEILFNSRNVFHTSFVFRCKQYLT